MSTLSLETVEAIIQLANKYGPEIVPAITALFKKGEPTIADVEAAFVNLKPYSAYGIPDVAPTKPV